jgi:hypothetical protein
MKYLNLDNSIKISTNPDIKMNISLSYLSKSIQGPSMLNEIWSLNAGGKWNFYRIEES